MNAEYEVVFHSERTGREYVEFEGTYLDCVAWLRKRISEAALTYYDIRNKETGRFMSWVL